MIGAILTARVLHARRSPGRRAVPLASPAEYAAVQAAWLAQDLFGARPHVEPAPVPARVDGGNWLVSCPCGNAPATDPDWRVAYCLACGAQFPAVVFPEDWRAIEAALVARPKLASRHSTSLVADGSRIYHTATELLAENGAHGIAEVA